MTPIEASLKENKGDVRKNLFPPSKSNKKPEFKVGNTVRLQKYKVFFEKG